MSLFKSELERYYFRIQSALENYIPETLAEYGDDLWKKNMHSFVIQGGKRLRPALAMMMADELGATSSEHTRVFLCLEVFHNFILSHDDIIDKDDTRWNNPTLHKAMQSNLSDLQIKDLKHFGAAQGIIGGDVLQSISQDCILDSSLKSSRKIALLKVISQTMKTVARGWYKQFLSDYIPLSQISLEYIIQHNLIGVTSSYSFLFPLQFGQTIATGLSEVSDDLRDFAYSLGILFQTQDDMIGLFGDSDVTGKSNCGDILQGKKTIPLYYAYKNSNEEDKKILEEKIGKKDLSDTEIVQIKNIIKDHGLEDSKKFCEKHTSLALDLLEKLPYSDQWKEIFRSLIEYLNTRKF